jgi:predicted ATP-grasp superfamily ATP-dependent carboligase
MKLLVLGTGPAQKDLIITAKNRGLHVYACSSKTGDIAQNFADDFKQIDIRNAEDIKQYIVQNEINCVYTVGSDFGIYSSHIVSQFLKLPAFNPDIDYNFINKSVIRAKLLGLPVNLRYIQAGNKEELESWDIFPCVVKPSDSQGQRGVIFVENKENLIESFNKSMNYSNSGELIIEEYIEGNEFSVNGYLVDSNIEFNFVTRRHSIGSEYGWKPSKHCINNNSIELNSHLKDVLFDTIRKLNWKNGPFYAQIKERNKEYYIIEITPRLDGCHLWRLIEYSCGINLLELTISHLVENHLPPIPNSFIIKPLDLYFHYTYSNDNYKKAIVGRNVIFSEDYFKPDEIAGGDFGDVVKSGYMIGKI